MASIEGGYISADGHFVEPADLWTSKLVAGNAASLCGLH
jgi:hypothetical protein